MNLKLSLLAIVTGVLFTLPIAGCSEKAPTSVVGDATAEDIEAYKRQIAADEAESDAEEAEGGE